MNATTSKLLTRYAKDLADRSGLYWKAILRGFKSEWKRMPPIQREQDLRKIRENMR